MALCLVAVARYYPKIQKEQWREAVALVEREAPAGGAILFYADYCRTTIYPYYATRTDLKTAGIPAQALGDPPTPASLMAELDRILPVAGPVWLIVSRGVDDHGKVLAETLETRLGKPILTRYKGIEVYRYPDIR